jgi:hypothetical protein
MVGWITIPPFFCFKDDSSMLVFIDESGKPHPKDSTKNPVLCFEIDRHGNWLFSAKTTMISSAIYIQPSR